MATAPLGQAVTILSPRQRQVVPISELVFGTLTQNWSSLEPSRGFAAIARHAALWIMHDTHKPLKSRRGTPKLWRIRPHVNVEVSVDRARRSISNWPGLVSEFASRFKTRQERALSGSGHERANALRGLCQLRTQAVQQQV
jgi:hypothetical protein